MLLAICGVVECKCSFYGDLLQSAKYLEILFDVNEFFWRVLAFLCACGVWECKCLFYGDSLQSAN